MGVDYLELGKKKYKISLCDLLDLQLPLFGIKINSKIFGVLLKKKKKSLIAVKFCQTLTGFISVPRQRQ